MAKKKSCFVIGPIGDEGSEDRDRSDQILRHIIQPAAAECGYAHDDIVRADKISKPGIITTQIIDHLMKDNLVIADLAGHNPNVFYELAVRHAVRKPVVLMIAVGEKIPFDVAPLRTIQLDYKNLDSAAAAKEEMAKHIKAADSNPADVDSPLSTAIQIKDLKASGNPLEKSVAEIIEMLQDIRGTLAVSSDVNDMSVTRRQLNRLSLMLHDLIQIQTQLREHVHLRIEVENASDMDELIGLIGETESLTSLFQDKVEEMITMLAAASWRGKR